MRLLKIFKRSNFIVKLENLKKKTVSFNYITNFIMTVSVNVNFGQQDLSTCTCKSHVGFCWKYYRMIHANLYSGSPSSVYCTLVRTYSTILNLNLNEVCKCTTIPCRWDETFHYARPLGNSAKCQEFRICRKLQRANYDILPLIMIPMGQLKAHVYHVLREKNSPYFYNVKLIIKYYKTRPFEA